MTNDFLTTSDKLTAFLSAVCAVCLFIAIGAFFMHVYHTALKPMPQGVPDMVCWEMPQADLKGWKRIPEWDRQRIADQVRRGKAKFREEWSLKCRLYSGEDIGEIMVREQWWRKK